MVGRKRESEYFLFTFCLRFIFIFHPSVVRFIVKRTNSLCISWVTKVHLAICEAQEYCL